MSDDHLYAHIIQTSTQFPTARNISGAVYDSRHVHMCNNSVPNTIQLSASLQHVLVMTDGDVSCDLLA